MLSQYVRAKFYTLTKLQGSIYTSRNYLRLLNAYDIAVAEWSTTVEII